MSSLDNKSITNKNQTKFKPYYLISSSEVIQLTKNNYDIIIETLKKFGIMSFQYYINGFFCYLNNIPEYTHGLMIKAPNGDFFVQEGEFIIKKPNGEIEVCKEDEFNKKYSNNIINQLDEYCANVRLHINTLSKKLMLKDKKIKYNILIKELKKYKKALEKDNKYIKNYINTYYGEYEKAKQFILFFIENALHFMEVGYKIAKNDKKENSIKKGKMNH
jgi:hypothetical protein